MSVTALTLEETLSPTATLQAAEARAVAAVTVLKQITEVRWACENGQAVMWQLATDALDHPDLTAARELIAKAAGFDDIYEALPDDSPARFPETGVSVLDEVKDLIRAKAKADKRQDLYTISVVQGVEGWAIYLNDYRIAGPKPWGGGTTLTTMKAKYSDVIKAMGGNNNAI